MALLDLAAKLWKVPAHTLLGGAQRQRLPISWVAYIRGADLLATEISEKVEAGFSAFKLKVGGDPAQDLERVRLLRRLAGPRAYIKLDASGQWTEDEAGERIDQLAAAGADAIETPIQAVSRTIAKNHPDRVNRDPGAAVAALARVRRDSPLPIIEHVADFADSFALALLHQQAVDVFNVVPAQAGSIHRAHRLLQLAETGGIDALLGSTVELGPGTAAALHLGLATKAVNKASDLVGPGLLTGDIVTPRLTYATGHLEAAPGPGLGLSLSADLLGQHSGAG